MSSNRLVSRVQPVWHVVDAKHEVRVAMVVSSHIRKKAHTQFP